MLNGSVLSGSVLNGSVLSKSIWRKSRVAALAVLVTLSLSGLAVARDRDGDDDDRYSRGGNPRQAHEYGRQNGYRDGYKQGREEGRERDPNDFRNPDWRQASRGYKNWMGPQNLYQDGYRDAYGQGFRAGYQSVWGAGRGREGDGDERIYRPYDPVVRPWGGRDGDGDRDNRSHGGDAARDWGYRDGQDAARSDSSVGKSFNPKPRGRYEDRDRGYKSYMGDEHEYRVQYDHAYREGYAAAWNPGRRGWRR